MNNKNSSKQILLSVIGIAILVVVVVGVTFAFFNYTRTGEANIIRTGQINFLTTQGTTLNLTNVFPIASNEVGNNNAMTLRIEGDTTYSGGEEFEITFESVNNTIGTGVNQKTIPINYIATYTPTATGENIGSEANEYYAERGLTNTVYDLTENGVIENGKQVLVGFIPRNGEIDGTLTIKAYIDISNVAVTDTLEGTEEASAEYEYGTTTEWVHGRTVLTTDEWNALQNQGNQLSFKIKAVSQEGTWVEAHYSRNDMNHLGALFNLSGAPFESYKTTITEINFIRMSEAEINTHENVEDLTLEGGQGVVKAWIENNKLYVASPGDTYFLPSSSGLLAGYTNVTTINFNNVNTSLVTDMSGIFSGDSSLTTIDLSSFNSDSLTGAASMFIGCTSLTSVNLSGFGNSNMSNLSSLFISCPSLTNINMSGFNFGRLSNLNSIGFTGATNLETLDLSDATFNGTSTNGAFANLTHLHTIYVSNTWDLSNVTNSTGMFNGCTSLVGGNGTKYIDKENALGSEDASHKDKTYAVIDDNSHEGYLTLKIN